MKVILTAAVALLLLIGAATASADSSTTTFEAPTFSTGTVNTQDGWKSAEPGDRADLPNGYDQKVVTNGASVPDVFGDQSLRISNAYTNGEFHYQTYSKPVQPAGEAESNKVLISELTFLSTTPEARQMGLAAAISQTDAEGDRMSYVRLEDSFDGIHVIFVDYPNGERVEQDTNRWIATLDRAVQHTIRIETKFVTGNDNDVVRVYIDGALKACGTTWENYYRFGDEQPQREANSSDRLMWRNGGAVVPDPALAPALLGKGFLFDNVTTTSQVGGGPEGCPLPVGPAGPAGPNGLAGPPGPAGQTIITGESAVGPRIIGNTRRVIHVPQRKGERLLSARATLRNKRLPVHVPHVIVDLRGKVVGNYNVFIVAKYRTTSGKVHVHRTHRSLSVTRALSEARMPA